MGPTKPQATGRQAVCAALLDFQHMPGRYPVAMREPRPVFEQLQLVLMLAAGRTVDGLGTDADLEARVRQAARFFVRTVLLRPGADHYTLLGVQPGVTAEGLREHYRLMIRLTHPDFTASGEPWPADAAARINIANDVLSSPARREAYQATRGAGQPTASADALVRALKSPLPLPRGPRAAAPGARSGAGEAAGRRRPSGLRAFAPAGVALVAVLGGVLLWPSTEDRSLMVATLPASPSTLAEAEAQQIPGHEPLAQPGQTVALERPEPSEGVLARLIPAPAPVPAPTEASAAQASPPDRPAAPLAPAESGAARAATPQEKATAPARPAAPALQPVARVAALRSGTIEAPLREVMFAPPTEALPAGTGDDASSVARQTADSPVPPLPVEMQRPAPVALVAAAAKPQTAGERPAAATPASTQGPVIHMGQVQPVLSNVTLALQSGRGEEALQWLERSSRTDAFAAQFVRKYHQTLGGARVTGLGQVRFTPRFAAEQLVVDGVVQLRLQDEKQQASVKDFHLRAYFRSQGSDPVLARLVAE